MSQEDPTKKEGQETNTAEANEKEVTADAVKALFEKGGRESAEAKAAYVAYIEQEGKKVAGDPVSWVANEVKNADFALECGLPDVALDVLDGAMQQADGIGNKALG